MWRKAQKFFERRSRIIRLELLERCEPFRDIGGDPNRLDQISDGTVTIAFAVPDKAAIVVGGGRDGAVRIETDRFGEVGDGAVKIVLLDPRAGAHISLVSRATAQVAGNTTLGIDADHL